MTTKRLGFIGAGQMAKAIGISLVKKEVLKPSQVIVSCPEEHLLVPWRDIGCATTFDNGEVIETSENVIWATKPQFFARAAQQAGTIKNPQLKPFHISIMAGIPLATFTGTLLSTIFSSRNQVGTARVMPNVGMKVGAGCAVYSMGEKASEEHEKTLTQFLSPISDCYKVPESQINAYCGLFASGIGFMFPILEAMSDGAVKMGIPRELSLKIAAQTMKGAAELILNDDHIHPGTLKDSVCSPGGTTIAGIAELEKFRIRHAFISAIVAATEKGEELGKIDEN
ncbi:unnamed protein product [Allacma fusca]|uniref:Pyrroline-5-carboxylate reductase n=1 Tax=Allacma fusca TaxID=39272 RepID=A0A8J2K3Z1_9HEXA|nr:unnamed protein product [Allacma fusca]